jgi:hypothetical protein
VRGGNFGSKLLNKVPLVHRLFLQHLASRILRIADSYLILYFVFLDEVEDGLAPAANSRNDAGGDD